MESVVEALSGSASCSMQGPVAPEERASLLRRLASDIRRGVLPRGG
jgi:hypothetical protein